jgi:hypothetical protein
MTTRATLVGETNACGEALYMALELSNHIWKVLFACSRSGRQRERKRVCACLGAARG